MASKATTATVAHPAEDGMPAALVPVWLLACYFCIVVGGGVVANLTLVVATLRAHRDRPGRPRPRRIASVSSFSSSSSSGAADDAVEPASSFSRWDAGGWWFLMAQLAAADALALLLVSGGELWSERETGGPWRLPACLCAPFMAVEAMLSAAQTYLLVALALHARATPADPVPRLSAWHGARARSAIVPSALVWMLASAVAVPRSFLAVAVSPRPSLPLCTLLPTSPRTGAPEGPLDVAVDAPNPAGSWWPLGPLAVDSQGGGPLLAAVVLCAAPTLVLLVTALPAVWAATRTSTRMALCRARRSLAHTPALCPPHKLARREWVRTSACLSVSWLLLSFPRLASTAAHGLLPAGTGAAPGMPSPGPSAFRSPPLGSRALPDASLLAVAMLHYALVAARPVLSAMASPALRGAVLAVLRLRQTDGDCDGTEPRQGQGGRQADDIMLC